MASVSTIYTMGTFLSRAEGLGQRVRVLVEGNWITGTPLSCDGHGVILDSGAEGQFLVRVEAISAASYALPEATVPRPRPHEGSGDRVRDDADDRAYEGTYATVASLS
ncbi:hypothetical protein EKO23_20220 [Nocardioides guangzhouensis]|uniref:Uncharacterized protein n=1 Tax=Nocardioides guangzhouensis TaxID=2497878 RepID=A0A4Q4Z7L9_9ACTN|nr:hypothetical protein [Nocardioides guangzhouensis]RYP83056.1 hypothetical protein EKO23_20220 [Nocardioides guangzhouensis]